jgi:DNA-3-methyladenine glycosylase
MHYCANIVVDQDGFSAAVLIRAVEPLNGFEELQAIRQVKPDYNLTNGPAKFCKAYGITTQQNGHNLKHSPIKLLLKPAINNKDIVTTTRIGISKAKEAPLRFYIRGNPYVSKT